MIAKSTDSEIATGVAWYRPEQWALLKAVSADSAELEDTHREWIEGAGRTLREMRDAGINPRKIDVDVDELAEWCKAEGRVVDGSARTEFVIHKMQEEDGD